MRQQGLPEKTVKVSFRVNPALEVPTHPKIATGLATSKFGIPHKEIPAAYREALACKNIQPVGIHCHIGSQILDVEPFARAAEVMVRIAKELTEMGVKLEFIDLGGGLGIPYHHDTDPAPTAEDYAAKVVPVFKAGMEACGITPELWVEPGRSLSPTPPSSSPGSTPRNQPTSALPTWTRGSTCSSAPRCTTPITRSSWPTRPMRR